MQRKLTELSDEELMILYQQGNQLAFNELYNRYSGQVYGFLRKRLPDTQSAGDVFQIAFLKLHKSRGQFNSSFPFAPWLFTVVRTVLLDWQKDKRNKQTDQQLNEELLAALACEPQTIVPADLSKLPEPQRAAIEMRYMNELSFDEIAAALATSPSNVRQLVSRGIKHLRAKLVRRGSNE